MDWMYNFNFTTDKVMRASWILAHPPSDLNGHILSSAGTSGREKRKEWFPTVCLMCRAAAYAPDITFFRVHPSVMWGADDHGADESKWGSAKRKWASQQQERCMSHRNLSRSQTWSCSLFIRLNFAGNNMIMTGGSCTKHLRLKFSLEAKLRLP